MVNLYIVCEFSLTSEYFILQNRSCNFNVLIFDFIYYLPFQSCRILLHNNAINILKNFVKTFSIVYSQYFPYMSMYKTQIFDVLPKIKIFCLYFYALCVVWKQFAIKQKRNEINNKQKEIVYIHCSRRCIEIFGVHITMK